MPHNPEPTEKHGTRLKYSIFSSMESPPNLPTLKEPMAVTGVVLHIPVHRTFVVLMMVRRQEAFSS